MGKIIIVAGILAGGKTTFSLKLSQKLKIPCFNKDLMKIELGKAMEVNNREESIKLSRATAHLLLHITEIMMKTGSPFIIEGNFKDTEKTKLIELLETYCYRPLTFLFTGNTDVMHRRFLEREHSPERHSVHKMYGLLDNVLEFEQLIKPLLEFNAGGKIVRIDTGDFSKINFDDYIKEGALLINEG